MHRGMDEEMDEQENGQERFGPGWSCLPHRRRSIVL
jgi:hypothetical protein